MDDDVRKLGWSYGMENIREKAELAITSTTDGITGGSPRAPALQTPGWDPHTIKERTHSHFRGTNLQNPFGSQPSAEQTGATTVGQQTQRSYENWISGLENFYRHIATDGQRRALGVVTVVVGSSAPSNIFEVIVSVKLTRVRVNPPKQEIAACCAVGRGGPLRHRLGKGAHDYPDYPAVRLGITADLRRRVLDIHQRSRRSDYLDGPVATRIA